MAAIGIILGICISIFGVYSLVTPFQTALAIGWIAGVVSCFTESRFLSQR